MQILLADFDNDGDLDLFLLDGPKFSNSTQGLLYRNNGSGGFTDVSAGSGLADVAASDYGNIIAADRSEEHTSELQSLMRISYAVFCSNKTRNPQSQSNHVCTQVTDTLHLRTLQHKKQHQKLTQN